MRHESRLIRRLYKFESGYSSCQRMLVASTGYAQGILNSFFACRLKIKWSLPVISKTAETYTRLRGAAYDK
ncbi:MAG TPA: hypothetical protein DG577_00680 [Firmicutes bacterium]|jgi:hypothetical protein|nr:hypothetical protein [Bacillota bacterium]HCX77905.1 hypothetical protein [Bacillota bacterium]